MTDHPAEAATRENGDLVENLAALLYATQFSRMDSEVDPADAAKWWDSIEFEENKRQWRWRARIAIAALTVRGK